MANTLVIKCPKSLTAPIPGVPAIPDTKTGLRFDLDARSLTLSNGDSVANWVAVGDAPIANRTFNSVAANWNFPKFSANGGPDGGKAVLFDGTQQIANPTGTRAYNQPMTIAMVVKAGAFAENQARMVTFGTGSLAPGNNGYYAFSGPGTRLESTLKGNNWAVIIVVFNGTTSKIKANALAIRNGTLDTSAFSKATIGGQGQALTTTGLVGGVARLKMYERALSDYDIEYLASELIAEYKIT